MRAPDWLIARPVAHRGPHDRARGIVENMPGAMHAAISGNFSIETDVQLTADGEAMVHHDDELGRLTEGSAPCSRRPPPNSKQIAFKDTPERMMSLGDPARSDRWPRRARDRDQEPLRRRPQTGHPRAPRFSKTYRGPVAWMSFDPDQVLAMREIAPEIPRGITAQRTCDDGEWLTLTQAQRDGMRHLRHAFRTRPHFVSYWVKELPAPAPWIARNLFGCALLTWTVRTPEQRAITARYADQMTFEGFVP